MPDDNIAIVTAKLDPESFRKLNTLRKLHYPKKLNHIDAHVTLFHKLPLDKVLATDIKKDLPTDEIKVSFEQPFFMGYGTAIKVQSDALLILHRAMKNLFNDDLSAQDRDLAHLHVTIQNKVASQTAKAFYENFSEDFEDFSGRVIGLDIWKYLGGPWKHKKTVPFD